MNDQAQANNPDSSKEEGGADWTRHLNVSFLPGNHIYPNVIVNTQSFDRLIHQLSSLYREKHPHLHVAFHLVCLVDCSDCIFVLHIQHPTYSLYLYWHFSTTNTTNQEYTIEANNQLISDDESWNQLLQLTGEEPIQTTVIVQVREKPDSSLETISRDWDKLKLENQRLLIERVRSQQQEDEQSSLYVIEDENSLSAQLQNDWFDFIVDRVLDKTSGGETTQGSEKEEVKEDEWNRDQSKGTKCNHNNLFIQISGVLYLFQDDETPFHE